MAVTTCLTFELVVLKRGKSTLEEGMLFPWLIAWLTPPSLGPCLPACQAAKLGYLPRMMASAIYRTSPGDCQTADSAVRSLWFTGAILQLSVGTFIL